MTVVCIHLGHNNRHCRYPLGRTTRVLLLVVLTPTRVRCLLLLTYARQTYVVRSHPAFQKYHSSNQSPTSLLHQLIRDHQQSYRAILRNRVGLVLKSTKRDRLLDLLLLLQALSIYDVNLFLVAPFVWPLFLTFYDPHIAVSLGLIHR